MNENANSPYYAQNQSSPEPSQFSHLLEDVSGSSCRNPKFLVKKWCRLRRYKKEQELKERQDFEEYFDVKSDMERSML